MGCTSLNQLKSSNEKYYINRFNDMQPGVLIKMLFLYQLVFGFSIYGWNIDGTYVVNGYIITWWKHLIMH